MNNPKPVPPNAPIRAEMSDWQVGHRIMVRVTLPEGSSHLYTDVLGTITHITSESLTLETRTGMREIEISKIAIGKLIPPPPPRRARKHTLFRHDEQQ